MPARCSVDKLRGNAHPLKHFAFVLNQKTLPSRLYFTFKAAAIFRISVACARNDKLEFRTTTLMPMRNSARVSQAGPLSRLQYFVQA